MNAPPQADSPERLADVPVHARRNRRIALALILLLLLGIIVAFLVWDTRGRRPSAPTAGIPAESALARCDELGYAVCERQVLHLSLPLAGTSIRLVYSSDRVPGRKVDTAPSTAQVGLGGWSLDVLRSFDPKSHTLITGQGSVRHVEGVAVSMDHGGVLAVADHDSRRVDVFDASGRDVAVYDTLTGSRILSFNWDEHGLRQVADRSGSALNIVRDANGSPVRIDSARGSKTRLTLASGWLKTVRSPMGSQITLTTGTSGLVSTLISANQLAQRFEYDEAGRLVRTTDQTGGVTTLVRKATAESATVTITGPTGMRTVDTTQTLPDGNLRYVHTGPAGAATTVDVLEKARRITLPNGRTVAIDLSPDSRWGMDAPYVQAASVTEPGASTPSIKTTQTRSGEGVLEAPHPWSETIVTNGRQWRYDFDPAARTLTASSPPGRRSVNHYDNSGRLISRDEDGGPTVRYDYDPQGRISSRTVGTGADARRWKYAYGTDGDTTITDPLGRDQLHLRNADGTLAQVRGPGDTSVILTFDPTAGLTHFGSSGQSSYALTHRADGRVAGLMAPAGNGPPQYALYDYDAAGALTKVSWRDATQTIQRDPFERPTSVDFGTGAWSVSYDKAGRIETTSGPGASIDSRYSAVGRIGEHVRGPFDVELAWTLDPFGRTTDESIGTGSTIKYRYADDGLLTDAGNLHVTRNPHSGLIEKETLGILTRSWQYNSFGELTEETITAAGGRTIADLTWHRDVLGRIDTKAEQIGDAPVRKEIYSYDPSGRLLKWTSDKRETRYEYDSSGNLVSVTTANSPVQKSRYDARNQLIERAGVQYRYNGAGQLVAQGATTLRYDTRGALLTVSRDDSMHIDYTTDYAGRRIARRVPGGMQQGLVYRDARGLYPSAELDSAGSVKLHYVYDGAGPPAYANKGGVDYLEVIDAVGSPELLIDARSGAIAEAVARDPFGRVVSDSAPGFQMVGFAGGLADPDTGLVHFGARDYDPQTGRWTAPDPLTVYGGSANLYSYVSSDPVNRTDRAGLCDIAQYGVTAGGALGSFGGTASFGLVNAGGQWGLYGTLGGGVGVGAGITAGGSCTDTNEPATGVDAANGTNASLDVGLGVAGGGVDFYDSGGGWHAEVGPTLGVSVYGGDTGTVCLFGCSADPDSDPELEKRTNEDNHSDDPDNPAAGCTGFDAGTCDPNAVKDPDVGDPDGQNQSDPSGGGGMCTGGGTCNEPKAGSAENNPYMLGGQHAADSGDPHLTTLDGQRYDMMAAGEFTALASDSRDLVIQTRQQPVGGSRSVASSRAAALNVLGDRLLVRAVDTQNLDVIANGTPVSGESHGRLPHGTLMWRSRGTLSLRLPDGSVILMTSTPIGLDIGASLADARKPHMRGILADLRSKDGTAFTGEQLRDYDTLYHRYVNSWRISQGDSLFLYATGESTATFTDTSFPARDPPPIPGDTRAAAQQICKGLSIPPEALDGCILDVATTGDASLAASTAAATGAIPGAPAPVSATVSTGLLPSVPTPELAAQVFAAGSTINGHLPANATAVYSMQVAANSIGYFKGGPDCKGVASLRWQIETAADSRSVGYQGVCSDIGRIAFPAAGAYRLRVFSYDRQPGDYRLSWIVSRGDRHQTLSVGQTATGSIDLPGAQDFYTLTGAPGTTAYFAAATGGCKSPASLRSSVQSSDGRSLAYRDLCSDMGRVVFPASGQFELRVNSVDATTGPYQIRWLASRADKHLTLLPGGQGSGALDMPGAIDVYDLQASAGTVAYLSATAHDCNRPTFRWSMETLGGSVLGYNGVCTDLGRIAFPSTGHYRLRVFAYDSATGDYHVNWIVSRPDEHRTLYPGERATGNINLPGADDVYELAGAAGSTGRFIGGAKCNPKLRWRVEQRDGSQALWGAGNCDNAAPVTFPSGGHYVLRIFGADGSTGVYDIRWEPRR